MILPFFTAPTFDLALPAGPSPVTNPLKGYAPYVESVPPQKVSFTMAYHYADWRELEPNEGQYAFERWEAKNLRSGLTKDRRVVVRVQMDYPNQPVAVPQWLIDKGAKMNPYNDKEVGKGLSPDYGDPKLRTALGRLIAAMGRRWNGNPQIGYVQLGLLGHWGEWHTWPQDKLFAPPEVQKEVVDAMRNAFPNKPLMARTATGTLSRPWMGYHDDMIPDDTLGSEDWKWLPNLTANGRKEAWKVAPTGGEMVPGAAKRYLGKDWPLTLRALEEGHLTWIGPYCPLLEDSTDGTYQARVAELSQRLGYTFRLRRVKSENGRVRLVGENLGVAPFYEAWPCRFALLDAGGKVVATSGSKADVRTWLPGPFSLDAPLPKAPRPGSYRLAFGLVDPWTKTPTVRFANRLAVQDGWTVLTPLP